jgi:hypothetical protein
MTENSKLDENIVILYAVKEEKQSSGRWISVKDYRRIYLDNEARNLIVGSFMKMK